MDRTAHCRDQCASSSDMLKCMTDCLKMSSGPVAPPRASSTAPKILGMNPKDKKVIIGSVVAVVAVVGAIFIMKKYRKH